MTFRPSTREQPKIEMTFDMEANGILNVEVRSWWFEWCGYKVLLQYSLRFDFLVMVLNYTPMVTFPAF